MLILINRLTTFKVHRFFIASSRAAPAWHSCRSAVDRYSYTFALLDVLCRRHQGAAGREA